MRAKRKPSMPVIEWDLKGGRDGRPVDLVKVLTKENGEQRFINKNANESTFEGLWHRGQIGMDEHQAGLRYYAAWRAAMVGSDSCKPMEHIPASGQWDSITQRKSEAYGFLSAVNLELARPDSELLYHLIIKDYTLAALKEHMRLKHHRRIDIHAMPSRCQAALKRLAMACENTSRFRNWVPAEA